MVDNRVEALFQNEDELKTREKILDVAIDLISKKGFEAVSIREIAREVGIRESSIYNHFKSKDEILDTIIDYFKAEVARASAMDRGMDEMLDELGVEGYMVTVGKMFMGSLRKPRIEKIWRIISIELYRNKKIRDFFNRNMVMTGVDGWEATFRHMIEKKLVKPLDPRMMAIEFFYFAIYLYFEYFVLKYDETYDSFMSTAEKEMADHIKFFINAVKA